MSGPTLDDLHRVSPVLAAFTKTNLVGDVWERPALGKRNRSLVTIAAQIARNQTIELDHQMNWALENGVKPGELSELIAHLAFYSGWAHAMAAVMIAKNVFDHRGVGVEQLPPAIVELLPLDEAAEANRRATVAANVGPTAPAVAEYTTDLLFRNLWLRPGLAPRDRSLVTLSALIATGQVAQVTFHLNRAMDNGLTNEQAAEVLTHLAFYAGWPNVMSAVPVVEDVFAKRTTR